MSLEKIGGNESIARGDPSRSKRIEEVRKEFIEKTLGRNSCHPAMSQRRLAQWRWISVSTIGAVTALLVSSFWNAGLGIAKGYLANGVIPSIGGVVAGLGGGLREFVSAIEFWRLAAVIVFTAVLSSVLTVALTIRWSMVGVQAAEASSGIQLTRKFAIGLIAIFTISAAVVWFVCNPLIPERWVAICAFGACIPVWAVIVYTEFATRNDEEGSNAFGLAWRICKQILVAATISSIAISGLPAAMNAVTGYAHTWIPPWFGWVKVIIVGALNISPIRIAIATSAILYVTFAASNRGKQTSSGKKRKFFKPIFWCFGFIAKFFKWIWAACRWLNPFRWFRSRQHVEQPKDILGQATIAPGWINSLQVAGRKQFGRFDCKWNSPICLENLPENGGFAPLIDGDEFNWIFGNKRPTVDQVRVLSAVQSLWTEHLDTLRQNSFGRCRESHADVLIQGAHECFEDTDDLSMRGILSACAAFAATSRGQRVLYFVPDSATRDEVVRYCRVAFDEMRLETLYSVEGLDTQSVRRWCAPALDPKVKTERRPPDIIVATLQDYELTFFGGALSAEVIRTVLYASEVVIVENLAGMLSHNEGQMHFPFLLDKHRLLLQAENRSMQLIVATPPIGPRPVEVDRSPQFGVNPSPSVEDIAQVALEALALRLFGGDSRLRGHHVSVRPRAISRPARLVVEVDVVNIDEAMKFTVARLAANEGSGSVCVIDGREQAKRSEESAVVFIKGDDPIDVFHESDLITQEDFQTSIHGRSAIAIQYRIGGRLLRRIQDLMIPSQLLLVFTSAKIDVELEVARWAPVFPVLPAAEAPALFLEHLRSAAYHFQPNAFIRRDDLARFGLSWSKSRWASSAEFAALNEGWHLECDGTFSATANAVKQLEQIWPAVILRADRMCPPHKVDLSAIVERSLSLEGKWKLFLAVESEVSDPHRNVRWVTRRGQDLGVVDIALLGTFVLGGLRQRYRPMSLILSEQGDKMIEATPYHGGTDEPIRPIIDVSFNLPVGAQMKRRHLKKADVLRLFVVQDGKTDRCTSTHRVIGLKDRLGNSSAFGPICYELRCGVSVLCIGSEKWTNEVVEPSTTTSADPGVSIEKLSNYFCGEWKVRQSQAVGDQGARRMFTPHITEAFQYAFASCAPGLLKFSRVLAFRDTECTDGVVLFCVEPHTTSGTAGEALQTILDDIVLRRRLIGKVVESACSERGLMVDLEAPDYDHGLSKDELKLDANWAREWATNRGIDPKLVPVAVSAIMRLPQPITAPDIQAVSDDVYEPNFSATIAPDSDYQWTWRSSTDPSKRVEFGVRIGVTDARATAATARFGFDPNSTGPEALSKCGFLRHDGGLIEADYRWMIDSSVGELGDLAIRLADLCIQANAHTTRDQLTLLASFVQSFEYRLQLEGRLSDGKVRCGVQMPLETLYSRSGDCDSVSILFVSLARAVGIAGWSCIVIVDEADGGHAMAAIQSSGGFLNDWGVLNVMDWSSRMQKTSTPQVIVELTAAGWALGDVSAEYKGRYVRIAALHETGGAK